MEVAARTCPTRLLTAQFQRRKGTKGTAFLRETFRKGVEHPDPAIAGNVMIGLTKLTNYLLDQQLHYLEKAFVKEGGLRERMTRTRLAERAKTRRDY